MTDNDLLLTVRKSTKMLIRDSGGVYLKINLGFKDRLGIELRSVDVIEEVIDAEIGSICRHKLR